MNIMFAGYGGSVLLQMSTIHGKILQQQKLQALSAKSMQHQMYVGNYANGTYMVTVSDEQGNRQTKKTSY